MASQGGVPSPFGQLVRRFREDAGLTQRELGRRARVSEAAVGAYENGRRRCPHQETRTMLYDGLGLGPDERALMEAAAREEPRRRRVRRADAPRAVFISHVSDLRDHPLGGSFVDAAERAVVTAGCDPVDMAYFAPGDTEPANRCIVEVASADVYVGIVGQRWGTPVPGREHLSYTELEFAAARTAHLPRLVFLVAEDAPDVPPPDQPAHHAARQAAFRRRLLAASGITVARVATPAELEIALSQALVQQGAGARAAAPPPVVPKAPPPPAPRQKVIRPRWAAALVALCTALAVCLSVAAPRMLPSAGVGLVKFIGSQAQPRAENAAMESMLSAFGTVAFESQLGAAGDVGTILAGQQNGVSEADLTDLTYSEMLGLQSHDALTDLTPLLHRLQRSRQFPPTLLSQGQFDTGRQYVIPWLQATYVMVVDRHALQYLPRGADVNHLTYDQLIAWGEAIRAATGHNRIGLPAELGAKGGLVYRFVQGYAYPSFTGGALSGFDSPDAIAMWSKLSRLWKVVDPASSRYTSMSQPLQSGEVWIAWDHQARLEAALAAGRPGQYLVVPAPSGPKGLGYMTTVVGLAIPKGATNEAGAEALIDWLTQPPQQAAAAQRLSFFPAVMGIPLSGPQERELLVQQAYAHSPQGVMAMPPAGLGSGSDEFTSVYQEAFQRIVIHGESPQSVLQYEKPRLQRLVDQAGARCWLPDPTTALPCRVG